MRKGKDDGFSKGEKAISQRKNKKLTPKQIKRIQLREKVSQPVFAEYLNASPSTIKKWETSEKHPTGPAL